MSSGPTKILVVDDSALYRQLIQNVLREIPDASFVGSAKDGREALDKIEQLQPDLLTLDVQMPDMDGIEVLQQIKQRKLPTKAIMVSSFTSKGAEVTTDALMQGAFDFILKPSKNNSTSNRQQLRDELEQRVALFRESPRGGRAKRLRSTAKLGQNASEGDSAPSPSAACKAIILGSSTGGPEALKTVLPRLPGDLSVAMLVVQHMPAQYTNSLAKRLDSICELHITEAVDGMTADAGKVIIAPGGTQMRLDRDGARLVVGVTDDPAENGVRPSVDYLIRSATTTLNGDALAVVMTGMGRDGLAGCRQLKQAGGFVFAQSQEDCVVYGMPKAVIDEGLADRTLPLGRIAPAIVRHIKRSRRP